MSPVVINIEALRRNFQLLCQQAGGLHKVMAVVKSDGYGHGMVACAKELQLAGCRAFGVGSINEAIILREQGIGARIIVFIGADAADFRAISRHDLEIVVYDERQLANFCQINSHKDLSKVAVHLKVDCGMGRLGFAPAQVFACCEQLRLSGALEMVGIMSHLPCADNDLFLSLRHNSTFAGAVEVAKSSGCRPQAHIANSAALLSDARFQWDLVRPGLALYGCYPSADPALQRVPLTPVMTVSSQVVQVKDVPSGTGVSYGLTQHVQRPSRLAVVDVGYGAGYSRALSGQGQVLIGGHRANIMGRVCMGLVVVDVTDIVGVERGDEVVLLGRQGNESISADEIAVWGDTISYEVLCMLGRNMKREYVDL